MKTIRIGNAAGFWGDNLDAPRLLCESAELDYLMLEYLAELTLSILAHQKSRDPENGGYVTDFPTVVESLIPSLKAQPGLKIVTNAGGMNPWACARRVAELLGAAGLGDSKIAVVTGDDLMPGLDSHLAAGETFASLETDEPLGELRQRVVSANAYLGADGIVRALSDGARIVITGRVADASLVVGPAVREFGWEWTDWNRLAAATVAGHLIECGAQVTGGMYSDWSESIALADVGYPIAELSDDGTTVITKPAGSGGMVTTETVAEQLVYEIGDPAHYLSPDVDADFSHVRLSDDGADRVAVAGARGNPAPERYKVSLSYADGYAASGTLVVCGPRATEKARACAEIVFKRVERAGFDLARTNVECLGAGDSLPGLWRVEGRGLRVEGETATPTSVGSQPSTLNPQPSGSEPAEVVLRLSVHDSSRDAVERFTRELAPLVTSGPPGVTGYTGARPKPHRVLAFWPTMISRSAVLPQVRVATASEWLRREEDGG